MQPTWIDPALFPWDTHHVDVGAGRMAWSDVGAGPPVVLVHGTPTWGVDWRHAVRALAPDHRCVVPDHLGFGRSDQPLAADYRPEAHAARFARFMDTLELPRASFVLHDFGVPFALPWLLAHPERVARLVIVNSWMWPLDDDPRLRRAARFAGSWLGRWLYTWLNASLRLITPAAYADRTRLTPDLRRQLLAPFRRRPARRAVLWALARSLLASRAHFADLWERRARLTAIPTTLVWGERDPTFGPAFLARWADALPRAAITTLPAGHWPHEEEPARFADALRAALA